MSADLEGLGLVELYDALEPIPEPEAISLVPQTVGWIWLGIGLMVGVVLVGRFLVQRRQARAYRRVALEQIRAVGDDPVALAGILRRTALVAYPRAEVAGLQGDAWLAFLNETSGGKGFDPGAGAALTSAPYRAGSGTPVPGLGKTAAHWVIHHGPLPKAVR